MKTKGFEVFSEPWIIVKLSLQQDRPDTHTHTLVHQLARPHTQICECTKLMLPWRPAWWADKVWLLTNEETRSNNMRILGKNARPSGKNTMASTGVMRTSLSSSRVPEELGNHRLLSCEASALLWVKRCPLQGDGRTTNPQTFSLCGRKIIDSFWTKTSE